MPQYLSSLWVALAVPCLLWSSWATRWSVILNRLKDCGIDGYGKLYHDSKDIIHKNNVLASSFYIKFVDGFVTYALILPCYQKLFLFDVV